MGTFMRGIDLTAFYDYIVIIRLAAKRLRTYGGGDCRPAPESDQRRQPRTSGRNDPAELIRILKPVMVKVAL